ncbi:hypothetical protein B0I35DRAFT_279447 [Stachybotrys elegans]|uniref:BZIP domain-containing protein n=1 Tax=Stachybotrys elegans TaxID=80388 RepID=A0A8K0SSC3_9HYPO|nr:hypothetical protein B0I35DRAFT_279447 [Stachybotrys elegans]
MTRAASADPPKTSKRKGTRSVSSLSPAQLERKRANDREAQRAIRQRTRVHIEKLEADVEGLKASIAFKNLQALSQRNAELEREVAALKEALNFPHQMTSTPYSTSAVFDDNLSAVSGHVPSPRTSPFPPGPGDYTPLDYSPPQFPHVTSNPEQWSAPTSAVSNSASGVPSPTSSVPPDDLYIGTPDMTPLRISHPVLPSNSRGTTSASSGSPSSSGSLMAPKSSKSDYDDVDAGRSGQVFQLSNQRMPGVMTSTPYMGQQPLPTQQHMSEQSQPWNMYHHGYYPQMQSQVQSPVH